MAARRRVGAVLRLLLAGWMALAAETIVSAAETTPATPLASCSDPDSFGAAADVGNNHLAVERVGTPQLGYRIVARWSRWDGQDLATSASRDLGRPIDWENARLVLRLREDSQKGVTLLTHEYVLDGAAYAGAESPQATVEVDPALLWPKSGGSVHVKVRVERPGLDLATCWAALPSAPSLDGAGQSSQSIDFSGSP